MRSVHAPPRPQLPHDAQPDAFGAGAGVGEPPGMATLRGTDGALPVPVWAGARGAGDGEWHAAHKYAYGHDGG